MPDPFEPPAEPGHQPWWLRDATDPELAKHQRLRNELGKLEADWALEEAVRRAKP